MKLATFILTFGLLGLFLGLPAHGQSTQEPTAPKCDQCAGKKFVVQPCEGCDGKKQTTCFECVKFWMKMARTVVAESQIEQELAKARGELFLDKLELHYWGIREWSSQKSSGVRRCRAGCNSKSKPKCKACKGVDRLKCAACKGKGKGQCDLCQGSGKRKLACSACQATGVQPAIRRGTVEDFSQCSWCEGQGTQACATCQSSGVSATRCRPCQGRGKRLCDQCKGQRPFGCSPCSGRGRGVPLSDMMGPVRKCTLCKGKGTRKCKLCSKGWNSCEDCDGNGKGRLACHQCHGKSRSLCLGCAGGSTRSWEWEAQRFIKQGERDQASRALAAAIKHQQQYLAWYGESLQQKFSDANTSPKKTEEFYARVHAKHGELIDAMERRFQASIGHLQRRIDKLRR